MKPSPQMGMQLLGSPVQAQPASAWQVNEQPSPLVRLPWSQVSPPRTRPDDWRRRTDESDQHRAAGRR